MFNRLRNKLIWINVGITSVVLLIVFTAIYIIYTQSANKRPPMPIDMSVYSFDVENIVEFTVRNEKQVAARELLIMLIVSGVVIEVAVAFVSYYLASLAIKPIKDSYDSQKLFIANASHEIKTPLAAISANLEAADVQGNRFIDNVLKETEKLTILNNELLSLARTDLVDSVSIEDTNLNKAIKQELASFEPRLKNIKLTQHFDNVDNIKINKNDFLQIFDILIDNAIKYCDKKISLSLTHHELSITNDGATISKKNLSHVFERFYQVDKSTEGVGLGLSIADSLAKRNNWSIIVDSNKKITKFILKY